MRRVLPPAACLVALVVPASPQSGALRLEPAPTAQDAEPLAPADWLRGADPLAGGEPASDETGAGLAFVETVVPRPWAFVGELLAIEVRFGIDAEFLAREVIPLFRRKLDVPVQLRADWLDEPASVELTRAFAADEHGERVTFARNDRSSHARRLADRTVNGRVFRIYAVSTRRIEDAPGTLHLAGPVLAFARGAAFTDDFLNGRVATESRVAFVRGTDVEIAIAPLPESGRPRDFSGAVGDFRLEARCEPDLTGPGVRLLVAIHGDGDLARANVPDATSFPGFRLVGLLDDHGHARRELTYDLVRVQPDMRRVPAIEFHYFDPTPPGKYAVALSEPLELPILAATHADESPASRPDEEPAGFGSRLRTLGLWIAAGIVGLVALALALRRARARNRTGGGSASEPPPGG